MRYVVVGTAGHIDHGKSTLVRALTGIDPDRLIEEKVRGITIDLGFAHDVRGEVTFAFVDVPGHERFVKNMLAGATGIDVLLLVVAADESVMPQTREHFDICRLLQVGRGVVALTKADVVDSDTIELVKLEVRDLVVGSFLADAPIVAVSALDGRGLDELRGALEEAARHVAGRPHDGAFRLPVDRVFSMKGFGTVVTGTVASGTAAVDDPLEILPSGRPVKVRALQGHGTSLARVIAGQRAAINLSGADVDDLTRGDCLVAPGRFAATRRLDASVDVLETTRAIRHGARVRFHQGTGETLGRVALARVLRPPPLDGVEPGEIPPGGRAHVRIRLERPVVSVRGDRFVLRAYSPPVTIAGGLVLDPHPPRSAIRTAAGRARFARLDAGETDARGEAPAVVDRVVEAFAEDSGGLGLADTALVSRVGLTPGAAAAAIERLTSSGALVAIGGAVVASRVAERLEHALLTALGEYHRAQPLSEGMPREEARERLFSRAHPALFEALVGRLATAGVLVARDRLALATHKVTLSAGEADARARVLAAFRSAGLRPPDPAALATELGLAPAVVDQALRLLLREKAIVRLDTLWFDQVALDRLKTDVRALKQGPAPVPLDVAAFKDRFGVSRKFAIPLLEYLDRERVTRRMGDARVVL